MLCKKSSILQLCTLLLAVIAVNSQNNWCNLTVSSQYAGDTVSHSFACTFTNYSLANGSFVLFNYSSLWNFATITHGDPNDFCETGCTIGSISPTLNSGNNVKLTGLFPNNLTFGYYSFRYTLKSIINPTLATSETISFGLYTNSGTSIATFSIPLIIYPAMMTCAGISTNAVVGQLSSYTFTITPSSTVPLLQTGYLIMTFPSVWENSQSGPTLVYSSCSNSLAISCVPGTNTVTASRLFDAASTLASFSFTLNSITNPGSQQWNDQTTFIYYYSNGSQASSCQVNISGLTSPVLSDMSFSIISNRGYLSFTNLIAPKTTDEVIMTLPSQVYLKDMLNVFLSRNNTKEITISARVLTGTNTIVFTGVFLTNSIFPFLVYSVMYLKTQITTTNAVTMSITRNGYQYSVGSCCNLSLNYQQSFSLSASLTNYLLKGTSNYIFNITPTYYAFTSLVIDFTPSFTLIPATVYPCYITTFISSNLLVCTSTSTSQITITLTNSSAYFTNYFGYQTSYSLVIIGLTNPSQLTTSVMFSSFYPTSQQLQYSNSYTITYSSTIIANAIVTSTSYVVGATANYNFAINNTNTLIAASVMIISFPLSFHLGSITCAINAISTACNVVNSSFVNFTLPNSAISQYGLTAFTLTVLNIVNPNSLEPTSSFGIQLYSGGTLVEAVYEGVTFAMTSLTNFLGLTVTPNTTIAGFLANYTISYTHNLTISASSTITLSITLPSSFTLVSCSACSSYSTFSISNALSDSRVISGVYNPQKITEITNIGVSLTINGYLAISDTRPSPSFTAETLSYSINSNSTFLGDPVNLNITYYSLPVNTGYIIATIPAEYTITTLTVTGDGSTNFTYSYIGYSLNISIIGVNALNCTFILMGLVNPVTSPSSFWQLNAYTATSILIATSSSNSKFTALCGSVCKWCINTTYCLTCYNNTLVNSLSYLKNSSSLCVASCVSTEFLYNSICYSCSSNCLTCSIFASNCTSCNGGLYILNNTCISLCPSGYYTSGVTCIQCTNNCLSCSSATICLSCSSNYALLSNSSCSTTCPTGQYNSSKFCRDCPFNCSTCTVSGCLTCSAGNYMVYLPFAICLSSCPQDLYISANSSICQACQSLCLTCSTHSTNCTSCNQLTINKYYSANACLTNCPAFSYPDSLNQCQACKTPCLACNGPSSCSSCIVNYYLYTANNECVASCFLNTIVVGSNCVQCVSPCLTCSVSVNNCTSCIQSNFLLNYTCSSSCPAPYVAVNGTCVNCTFPCQTCMANNVVCTSCVTGYYYFPTNKICYSACPNNTYQDTASTCAVCTNSCYSCSISPANCTACYNGSMLLNNVCYSPCPPLYYEMNSGCSLCQPQCLSCTYQYADQCSECSSSIYYYNPITYHCTINCSSPYFINNSTSQCNLCQLPCKSCTVYSTACSGCYEGLFLLNMQCGNSCPSNYYSDSLGNVCVQCTSPCATCDSQKCLTCSLGSYFYDGMCYNTCPSNVPYTISGYCSNCLLSNCIICNSGGICSVCLPGSLNYDGNCVSSCPSDYQPDLLTASRCILKAQIAFNNYIRGQESKKILSFPATAIFVVCLPIIFCAEIKLFLFAWLLAIPQALSLVELTANYWHESANLTNPLLPQWFMLPFIISFLCFSCIYVFSLFYSLSSEKEFKQWLRYGKNKFRFVVVFLFSLLSQQLIFLLFTGLFGLPITTLKFKPERLFYICHVFSIIIKGAILGAAVVLSFLEQTISYDYKVYFSAVDTIVVYSISIVFDVVFLILAHRQKQPTPYQKYIIPVVSIISLPPTSEQAVQEIEEQTNPNVLHRSNSDEDMFQSKEMKDVDFLSVIDPDDYFDSTPKMANKKIPQGVDKGDFRKKNKKKRGLRRKGQLDLDVIQEQQQNEELLKKEKDKKKKRTKKENLGGLKDFIYYKKPTVEKKDNPGKKFKENEKQIMERIHQKQSEFDTITQNDVIFQEEVIESSEDEYDFHESRRALYKPSYDNYFNLNYADRQHLR